MKNKKKNPFRPNKLLLLAIFIALSSLFAGGFLYYEHHKALKIQKQEEIDRLEAEHQKNVAKQKREMQALFDVYLKQFVLDLKQGVQRYKKARKIIYDLVQPYNFETPEYARENYKIFTENVAPTLRQESDNVIGIFAYYQALLETDLQNKDGSIQQEFSNEWKAMSSEQAGVYVNFFTSQEELLRAYEELIKFYYVYSKLYDVDVEENEFSFKRDQDAQLHDKLLKAVEDLR